MQSSLEDSIFKQPNRANPPFRILKIRSPPENLLRSLTVLPVFVPSQQLRYVQPVVLLSTHAQYYPLPIQTGSAMSVIAEPRLRKHPTEAGA
jgi:hypothetical protein